MANNRVRSIFTRLLEYTEVHLAKSAAYAALAQGPSGTKPTSIFSAPETRLYNGVLTGEWASKREVRNADGVLPKLKKQKAALTPTLSHPMGEGEPTHAFNANDSALRSTSSGAVPSPIG
jgi:hypothetical protein